MKTTVHPKAICCLLVVVVLLLFSACSGDQVKHAEDNTAIPVQNPTGDLFYDYELLYSYHNTEYDPENLVKIVELLQSKDILTVAGTTNDNGILRIDFRLRLSEAEPKYTVNYTKQMQDAIVLFALFDYLLGVEFNYVQADYSFGGVPILREEAEALFGKPIAPFGSTQKKFVEEFPREVQAVVWEPEVMDTVNYYHAMGLGE